MNKKYSAKKLSVKKLEHGRKQVLKMLKDRPDMGKYININDAIWKWIVKKFAGEDLLDTINWTPEQPLSDYPAEYSSPTTKKRGCIRIRDHFEPYWTSAVFELYNIANTANVNKIDQKVLAGRLLKKDYIEECAKLEYKAIKKTKRFYKAIWKPWAKKKGFPTNPHTWFGWVPNSYNKWIKRFKKKADYPWGCFGRHYDKLKKWQKDTKKVS